MKILSLQDEEGKWGNFHSMSKFVNTTITTEHALSRLKRLGYTIEDECIKRAVEYLSACLSGEKSISDRVEWDLRCWDCFEKLMLSCRIRKFTAANDQVNEIAEKWAQLIKLTFEGGSFDGEKYTEEFKSIFNVPQKGDRLKDFTNFYVVSVTPDFLGAKSQQLYMEHILNKDDGIYYIYNDKLSVLPERFDSLKASRYIAAMELLVNLGAAKHKLGYVLEWLEDNRRGNGQWDMGQSVNDMVYFPLSENWRKAQTRVDDCTRRISALVERLKV